MSCPFFLFFDICYQIMHLSFAFFYFILLLLNSRLVLFSSSMKEQVNTDCLKNLLLDKSFTRKCPALWKLHKASSLMQCHFLCVEGNVFTGKVYYTFPVKSPQSSPCILTCLLAAFLNTDLISHIAVYIPRVWAVWKLPHGTYTYSKMI